MHIDEISNCALRDMVRDGDLDDPSMVTRIFTHRYSGGQCDWGYIDASGYYYAWYGGDSATTIDDPDDLDISGPEIMPGEIARD